MTASEPQPKPPAQRPQNASPLIPAWGLRDWFQLGMLLLCLAIGLQFYFYVGQLMGGGLLTIERPPGVEGFLPIGALMGWKRFLLSGQWDTIHPAAMVIFGFAIVLSLLLRKSFCAWFCPLGGPSEWLWRLGLRLFKREKRLPRWVDLPLRSCKYLLLAFFGWIILQMSVTAIEAFTHSPYYRISDVKMLTFFTDISPLAAAVLLVLVVGSLVIRHFWCRYFCPYGALVGLLGMFGPTGIERNTATCTDCGRCGRACPHHLPVDRKRRIRSAECSGCLTCTRVCPVDNTLELKTTGLRKWVWTPAKMSLIIALSFVTIIYGARISGLWQTRMSHQELRNLVNDINAPHMVHPRVRGRK